MLKSRLCSSVLMAALIAVPVQRAQAGDAGAALGGLILGGIITATQYR